LSNIRSTNQIDNFGDVLHQGVRQVAHRYWLEDISTDARSEASLSVGISTYGGAVTNLRMPSAISDAVGKKCLDVVLGYDDVDGYVTGEDYHGVIIGRYANRIKHGQFTLDDQSYQLSRGGLDHHLHGGSKGLHSKLWQVEHYDQQSIAMTTSSPDGEEGYPGTLQVKAIYRVTTPLRLELEIQATTDRPTILNLTHHGYINLNGHASGDITDHMLQIRADQVIPATEQLLPAGPTQMVTDTIFDFRQPLRIGSHLYNPILKPAGGYDHGFMLTDEASKPAATLQNSEGLGMHLYTDQPSLHVYTGNHLKPAPLGKQGTSYSRFGGIALEAQHPADAPNRAYFPSTVLRPEEVFRRRIAWEFFYSGAHS